jgi:hypothetical protein
MTVGARWILVAGLLMLGASGAAAKPKQTKRVAGKAVQVSSVCGGGAAISPDAVARLPPPQPIAGRDFLVVAGERISAARPAARFTTRADGSFVTRLSPGTWCFFDAARRPSDDPAASASPAAPVAPNTVADCLAAQRQRCDLVLAVESDVTNADITLTTRCSEPWNQPCYRGPMPP